MKPIVNQHLDDSVLYYDCIKDTIQYPTYTGTDITKIEHRIGSQAGTLVREDTFTFTPTLITEVRTFTRTGATLTLNHYFDVDGNFVRTEVI